MAVPLYAARARADTAGVVAAREPSIRFKLEVRETRIFGLVFAEQRRSIERRIGTEKFAGALATLPADRRTEIAELSPFGWCRTSTAAALITAAASEAGISAADLTRVIVRDGFGLVMRTAWRLFVAFSDDEAIVRRAGTVYTKTIDRGRATATVQAPGHLVLEVTEWPDISPIDIIAIASGIEAALEVASRRAEVQHRRVRGQDVRFDVRVQRLDPA